MEDKTNENTEQPELFSNINNNPGETGGSSKAGSIVVLLCCLLTFFFGGWVPLIMAVAVFTPFRKQTNGWLIFLGAYLIANVFFFLVVKSIF